MEEKHTECTEKCAHTHSSPCITQGAFEKAPLILGWKKLERLGYKNSLRMGWPIGNPALCVKEGNDDIMLRGGALRWTRALVPDIWSIAGVREKRAGFCSNRMACKENVQGSPPGPQFDFLAHGRRSAGYMGST